MTLEFRLLGDVEVWREGQLITIPGQIQRMLAVLLVEANHTVPVDQLLDRVWGEQPLPKKPSSAIQTYMSKLRAALGAQEGIQIVKRSTGYQLTVDEATIDLHRFQALLVQARAASDDDRAALLTEALALWRGEPFACLDAPWFNTVRAMLASQRHTAQLDLADIRLRHGEHAGLVAELAHIAEEHPLDERLACQLILALYRSGRQAAALAHYEQIRRRLAGELGADPSPPLRQLHQQILTADPALTVLAAMAVPAARRSADHPPDAMPVVSRTASRALPGPQGPGPRSRQRRIRRRVKRLTVTSATIVATALATAATVHLVTPPPASERASSLPGPAASHHANSPGPASPSSITPHDRWAAGLNALRIHMNTVLAQADRSPTVTPSSLREMAAALRTCAPMLARLGIPGVQFTSEHALYEQAKQACAQFTQAAVCDEAAARAFTTDGSGPKAQKFSRLSNCEVAGINKGAHLLSDAAYTASL